MIKPIHNDEDHESALKRINEIWNADDNSPEADELEVLAILISDYESRRYPFSPPEPIEAIRFHMQQNNYQQEDLAKVIGSMTRALQILSLTRSLTLKNVKDIHKAWGIPLTSLIKIEHNNAT